MRAASGWLAVWMTALPAAAWAQAVDARVEAMLREGIAHRVAGRDEAAVERFEAAYAAQRAPITAGQLALACQAAGRWVEADRYMREALSSPDDDWVRRHRRELDEAYAVVRRNVGELELRGGPDGAAVRVEGATVGTLPLAAPLRLRAGAATVEVRAEGYLPLTRQVTILGGELTREPVAMTAIPREPTPATPVVPASVTSPPVIAPRVEAPRAGFRVPTVSWALWGVGAALLAGGAVSIGLREASVSRFNANTACESDDAVARASQTPACRDELEIGDWTTATAVAGFAGGAALVGVGVLLAVLPRRAEARAVWHCAPALGGVTCAATF